MRPMASLMTTKLKPQTTATEKSVRSATSCSRRPRPGGLGRRRARVGHRAPGPATSGGDAAVDRPGDARDPAGLVGGEEGDDRRDLLGAADAPQGIGVGRAAAYAAGSADPAMALSIIGVSTTPGETQTRRMPSGPWSMARERVSMMRPALAAE